MNSSNQDAYFSLLKLEDGHSIDYQLHNIQNGVYIFLIAGSAKIDDLNLEARDGVVAVSLHWSIAPLVFTLTLIIFYCYLYRVRSRC